MIGPAASSLLQLGFAAPTRETSESLNRVPGFRVCSHNTSPNDRDVHGLSPRMPQRAARESTLRDRKSTRLNSSHVAISYAVFCLKKKKGGRGWGSGKIGQARIIRATPVRLARWRIG